MADVYHQNSFRKRAAYHQSDAESPTRRCIQAISTTGRLENHYRKNDSNEVTTITWEAEGDNEGILAGQFQQFNFVAQNPDAETEVAWDAFQYYSDGSIVEWTGGPSDSNPHSITAISQDPAAAGNAEAGGGHDSAGTAGNAGHDDEAAAGDDTKANDDTTLGDALSDTVTGEPNNTDSDPGTLKLQQATLIVSILALIMSFLGIALATRRKRR